MPRVSKLAKLPTDVRRELDDRLRASGYGDLVQTADWLTGMGYALSKSAMGRYSAGLKQEDTISGRNVASVRLSMQAAATPEVVGGRKAALLAELGRLRMYEHSILEELKAIVALEGASAPPAVSPA